MKRSWLAVLVLLVIILGGIVFWYFLNMSKGKVLSLTTDFNSEIVNYESLITFISDRDGNDEVYLINDQGTFLRRVTFTPQREFLPVLSPNTKGVAYFSERNGFNRLIFYSLEEGESRLLGITRGKPKLLKFSMDGRHLAFIENSETEADSELFLIRVKDGKMERAAINVQDFTWSGASEIIYTEKNPEESITITKLFVRRIEEEEKLSPAIFLASGGVAPVYLSSSDKILFLDTTSEFFRLMATNLRGENSIELFGIKIRPQENTQYFMELSPKEDEIIFTIFSNLVLIDSLIISLPDQTVKTLDLETSQLTWTRTGKIVFVSKNQVGDLEIWLKENSAAEAKKVTKVRQ